MRSPARCRPAGQTIENRPAQGVTLRHEGMLEIAGLIVDHPDPRPHPAGAGVRRNRMCHHFLEPEGTKSERERGPGGFGRVTTAPDIPLQPPTDLYCGSKCCAHR